MHNISFLFCILDHNSSSQIITKDIKFYSVKFFSMYKIIDKNLLIIRSATITEMHELCEISADAIYTRRFKVTTLNFWFSRIIKWIKKEKIPSPLCLYKLDLLESNFLVVDDMYIRIQSIWIWTTNSIALFFSNNIAICPLPLNAMQNTVIDTNISIYTNLAFLVIKTY